MKSKPLILSLAIACWSSLMFGAQDALETAVTDALKRLTTLPTTCTLYGEVITTFHQPQPVPGEAALSAKRINASVQTLKQTTAETMEVFGDSQYRCEQTFIALPEDDSTSEVLFHECVLVDSNLAAAERSNSGGKAYLVASKSDKAKLQQNVITVANALQGSNIRQIAGNFLKSPGAEWTAKLTDNGRNLVQTVQRKNAQVINEYELDKSGRLTNFTQKVATKSRTWETSAFVFEYAGAVDIPSRVEQREYTEMPDGPSQLNRTVVINVKSFDAKASPEKLMSVEAFLAERQARTVQDLRMGKSIPVAALKF